MKGREAMRHVSDRTLSRALRAVLTAVALAFAGLLVLMNFERIESERAYPALAHLGWPVYLAVIAGFVPVFLGIGSAWRWTRLAGRGAGRSPAAVAAVRRISHCGLAVSAWFTAGLPAWLIASGGMDPPFITLWMLVNVPTWFVILTAALFARALAQD